MVQPWGLALFTSREQRERFIDWARNLDLSGVVVDPLDFEGAVRLSAPNDAGRERLLRGVQKHGGEMLPDVTWGSRDRHSPPEAEQEPIVEPAGVEVRRDHVAAEIEIDVP